MTAPYPKDEMLMKPSREIASASQPKLVSGSFPDLSQETIKRFVERAEIADDSHVVVSVPAGPNRDRNFMPALNIANSLQREFPDARFVLDLAIDLDEAMCEIVDPDHGSDLPSASAIRKFYPQFEESGLQVRPRLQPPTNSVVEVVKAMGEAAESGATHLIAPRSSQALAKRVERGLRHYAKKLVDSSLEIVAAPAHALYRDENPGRHKRAAYEVVSYLASEAVYRLGGASLFEQFTERKGVFERIAKKAQEIKLRSFERGDDARQTHT